MIFVRKKIDFLIIYGHRDNLFNNKEGNSGFEQFVTRMDSPKSEIGLETGAHFCLMCYLH